MHTPKYLFFDTETGGDNKNYNDVLQLAWCLTDDKFNPIRSASHFFEQVLPSTIKARARNGLTKEFLRKNASLPLQVYKEFYEDLKQSDYLVGHLVDFDIEFVCADCLRRLPHSEYDGFVPQELCNELKRKRAIDTYYMPSNFADVEVEANRLRMIQLAKR